MSRSKIPAVVLYSAQGRTQMALVLNSRDGEVSHLGANGEPLLTLAIVKQIPPNAPYKRPVGVQVVATPEVEIVHDVVHASHEFDEEFLKKNGDSLAQQLSQRGHGEWSEYVADDEALVANLREAANGLALSLTAAQGEANTQRARADLAEQLVASLRAELEAGKTAAPKPAIEIVEPTEREGE
jgi:hypothetical protein